MRLSQATGKSMDRRNFLRTTTAMVGALTMSDISSLADVGKITTNRTKKPTDKAKLPNIVFILSDDMGYGDVGILNKRDHKIPTPNIDRIGREGMIFTDAHSGSAVCTPTRYGVLTGRYAWRTRLKRGVLSGYSKHLIESGRLTVPALLKNYGYNTAGFGKWHLGMDFPHKDGKVDWHGQIKYSPVTNGFDYFYGISASLDMPPYIYIENNHFVGECTRQFPGMTHCRKGPITDYFKFEEALPTITDKTVGYIKQQTANKPFFVYMALTAPHTPLVPSKPFKGKNPLGAYGDFCEEVDYIVGRVLNALDEKGFADNTLVIFTSDNGCAPYIGVKALEAKGHYPSYIYRGYKSDIFEGGHRIPFLARWPGHIKAGSINGEVICLTDLMATCAAIVGAKLPDNAGEDSYNILPALLDQHKQITETKKRISMIIKSTANSTGAPIREATVHHSINGSFAIRQGKWKLEMCPGSGGWGYPKPNVAKRLHLPPVQLYDMTLDVRERKNVYKQHPDVVKRLKKLLASYILKGRSTPGKPQPYINPSHWPQIDWMKNN